MATLPTRNRRIQVSAAGEKIWAIPGRPTLEHYATDNPRDPESFLFWNPPRATELIEARSRAEHEW
jgi:hypothetical protein